MHLASRAQSYYIISEMSCWWEWILNKVLSAKQVILSATDLMRPICWGFALLFGFSIVSCGGDLNPSFSCGRGAFCGVSLSVTVLNQTVPRNISGHLHLRLCTVKLSKWCLALCWPVPIAVSQMAPEHSLRASFGQGHFQQVVFAFVHPVLEGKSV